MNGREKGMDGSFAIESRADHDLLQASRRLDWRFLLPDPTLGAVAYAGPEQTTLLESLQLFGASVTALAHPIAPVRDHSRPYDLAVLVEPSHGTLRRSVELLRADGAIYLETRQRFRPLRAYGTRRRHGEHATPATLALPADYVHALGRLGLVDVRRYWHWPSFESCAEIVPLEDPTALMHFFSRRGGSRLARVRAALGRSLVKRRCLADLVPCVSIVALNRASGT
jgi:hypothetical protein